MLCNVDILSVMERSRAEEPGGGISGRMSEKIRGPSLTSLAGPVQCVG